VYSLERRRISRIISNNDSAISLTDALGLDIWVLVMIFPFKSTKRPTIFIRFKPTPITKPARGFRSSSTGLLPPSETSSSFS